MVSRQLKHFTSPRAKRKKHQGISLADKKRIEERRQNALQLRMAGATLQDIVNAGIGYNNTQMASKDLDRALEGFYAEDIEKLLILDLARIDEMQKLCTIAMRYNGDLGQVRNIMALMQFRRETLGITPELLQDKQNEAARVVNNGIMVVQGTTRDYLASMMEASGASPDEIQKELRELESASESTSGNVTGNVIQGEVIAPETHPETASETSTETGTGKRTVKVRVRVKKNPETSPAPPGNKNTSTTRSARHIPSESLESLSRRVEETAVHMDQDHDRKSAPRLGKLDDPAVVPAGEKYLEIPVKLPDANRPVSPGVVYRNPPRKPTQEEGKRLVTRRMGRDASTDRIRTRVVEEPIE